MSKASAMRSAINKRRQFPDRIEGMGRYCGTYDGEPAYTMQTTSHDHCVNGERHPKPRILINGKIALCDSCYEQWYPQRDPVCICCLKTMGKLIEPKRREFGRETEHGWVCDVCHDWSDSYARHVEYWENDANVIAHAKEIRKVEKKKVAPPTNLRAEPAELVAEAEINLLITALQLHFGVDGQEVIRRAIVLLAESEGIGDLVAVGRNSRKAQVTSKLAMMPEKNK